MTQAISSQQVDWWAVHEFVVPVLDRAGSWPMAGTIDWCDLNDDDPRKLAALLDAARHHILRVDTAQGAMSQAGNAISAADDWTAVSQRFLRRRIWEKAHPWHRRAAA